MKIIIDGFGGDFAPRVPLEASVAAAKEYGVDIAVCGDREKLEACAKENGIDIDNIEIIDASDVMPVEAEPTSILKAHSNSSMAVGLRAVSEGRGDAFVSAGSTGALVVGGTFIVKRIRGIKRPMLGTLIPMQGGGFFFLADCGANHDCRPEMLVQFALMGTAYQKAVRGVENPRVGLINIGTEDNKGTELQVQALPLLRNAPVNFVGNVEARELMLNACDVAVCDGFTGNIILKHTEGLAKFFTNALKDIFYTNTLTKLSALCVKKQFSEFKKQLDYREQGGVPILGVRAPVIKAHGSSDTRALKNAIKQAKICIEQDVIGEIERGVAAINASGEDAKQ